MPGIAAATKVPAACTAQALNEALAQAGNQVTVAKTTVVGSQFACIRGYAKAIVYTQGWGRVWAFWHDESGDWTVLWVGQEDIPGSALGVPDDVLTQLKGQVQ
jgi:hypothetical protein